ncbi:MAG: DUF429 domain-containing protein [Thermodesulfobacteriota bacterium]
MRVDIPIGLRDHGPERSCDLEARRLLGIRRSSVFPVPCRSAVYPQDVTVQRVHVGSRLRRGGPTCTPLRIRARPERGYPQSLNRCANATPSGIATPPRQPAGAALSQEFLRMGVRGKELLARSSFPRKLRLLEEPFGISCRPVVAPRQRPCA